MTLPIPPIGFHSLRDFEKRGAAWWRGRYLDRTIPPTPSTMAQTIGTAVHHAALEGEAVLASKFATAPAGEWESEDRKVAQECAAGAEPFLLPEAVNRRTNAGKAQWAAAVEAAAGKRILVTAERERLEPLVAAYRATNGRVLLSATDWAMVCRMGQAVRAHPDAMRLIEGAGVEVELDAVAHVSGMMGDTAIPVRGRLDIAGRNYVADLKTCEDITADVFDRTVANYEYFRQLAYYDMLRDLSHTGDVASDSIADPDAAAFLIAVEKPDTPECPVRVEVMSVDDDYLEIGARKNADSLAKLAATFAADAWEPIKPGVRRLSPPRWLY